MSLVNTDWLFKNIGKVKIIDSSWHLPNENRDAFEEYKKEHIKGSIFFDIDKYSDKKSDLPHMLPSKEEWELFMSSLGISNDDTIVIYDNSHLISSCRCWYTFLYFGHTPNSVFILDGGLKKWKEEDKEIVKSITNISKSKYFATVNKRLVKNKTEIEQNISQKKFKVIDARSKKRFDGKEVEQRKGLRSGSIPGSFSLPFRHLINDDNTFKKKDEIKVEFGNIINLTENNIVFSCGSGITASVLALGYSLINNKYSPIVYDGSWSEYGKE
ncbi:MAG: sulfurtransferase [Candidatus Pelagibacter sp. TMED275]|nr:MAG: sulfurtransferase [Candidatus Pelagibacter sp. TMED275]|tara:strand:+ start:55 stop:867 length:813 start_codon:yes stop_codon:yes gene_type:complete